MLGATFSARGYARPQPVTSDSINLVQTLATAVRDDAGYDADRYAGTAAEHVDPIRLPPLLPPEFDRLLSIVEGLRKRDRFQSLAMSTVLTCLDLGQVDAERLGLLYKLHGLLALNLNCSGTAYEASLTAVRHLPQSRGQEIAESYSQAATAARNERRFPDALSLFTKARDIALTSARPVLAAWQWFRLGKMYVNYLQQPSRGFTYVSIADAEFQAHSEQIAARRGHSACLDELGDFYRETAGDTARAVQLYEGAASLNREIGNRSGLARNLAHLGLCAVAEGHLCAARDLLQESLAVLRTCSGEARGVGLRLGQYARVCIALGEGAAAAVALAEATSLAEQYRDANTLRQTRIVWALLRRQQGEPLRAKAHLTRAVDLSRERGLYAVGAAAHEMLASLARDEFNDYESAKNHLQESIHARVEAWEDVSRGNPKLEEVEDARELGRMYKSLFERLLEQYKRQSVGQHSIGAGRVRGGAQGTR